jgi:hypothetical protein
MVPPHLSKDFITLPNFVCVYMYKEQLSQFLNQLILDF